MHDAHGARESKSTKWCHGIRDAFSTLAKRENRKERDAMPGIDTSTMARLSEGGTYKRAAGEKAPVKPSPLRSLPAISACTLNRFDG